MLNKILLVTVLAPTLVLAANSISMQVKGKGVDAKNNPISFDEAMKSAKRVEFTDVEITVLSDEMKKPKKVDQQTQVGELKIRGQSCLSAKRKCLGFKIKGQDPKKVHFDGESNLEGKKFNLVSMWLDKGYVSSKLGFDFFRNLGLFDFRSEYAILQLNNKNQGLYLVTEKPSHAITRAALSTNTQFQSLKAKLKASDNKNAIKDLEDGFEEKVCIGRRGYGAKLEMSVEEDDNGQQTNKAINDKCQNNFREIYSQIQRLSGQELVQYLDSKINLKQYIQWLVGNSIIINGDYADEVYLYADMNLPQAKFQIMPWDFDDLFKSPHSSVENDQTYKELFKSTILYSFENPLDVKIATDPVLYEMVKSEARAMLAIVNDQFLEKLKISVLTAINPYLDNQEAMGPSVLDNNFKDTRLYKTNAAIADSKTKLAYNREFVTQVLNERIVEIKNRIALIKKKLQ